MNDYLWRRVRIALLVSLGVGLGNTAFAVLWALRDASFLLQWNAIFWIAAAIINVLIGICAVCEYPRSTIFLGFATSVTIGVLWVFWPTAVLCYSIILFFTTILHEPTFFNSLGFLAALLGSLSIPVMSVQCYRAADMLLYRRRQRPRVYRPLAERLPERWRA